MISIYKITNIQNNKVYIGQTINTIECRFKQHLRENRGSNLLHKDMQIQNKEDFKIILIDRAETQIEADEKERFWISFYNSTNTEYGYNLDSGGKNSCTKSSTALNNMRDAVLRSWDDEETSERMLEGLRKGTDTWKKICMENRVEFICPICKNILKLPKHEIKNRKTCGNVYCKNEFAKLNNTFNKGLDEANKVNAIKYKEKSEKIKDFVIKWALKNKDIINECPKNKIVISLNDLINEVYINFNVKDIRSISKSCCDTSSKIKFLEWLKNEIK